MKKPELLSPAGSPESLKAAVQNGADAVYLGGKKFGARAFSANFSEDELRGAVTYCHSYGVRVYVTFNTILFPEEMGQAASYGRFLNSIGVDGVLVQDLGLAELLSSRFPDLPLHASTQMHLHDQDGVRFALRHGFRRVVLARETSAEEVRECAALPVETEIFVSGALCVCCSGQCYFSLDMGPRSGNRGDCAQPCRMPFTLLEDGCPVPAEGQYLLSPKDLYTLNRVPELLSLGATCWKIEGRMKRPEYVAFMTSQYRQAIDAAVEGKPFQPDIDGAARLFNRGFTEGHLFSMRGSRLMNPVRPNHAGVPLGEVVSASPRGLEIRTDIPLTQGDGMRIQGKSDEGFLVSRMEKDGLLIRQSKAGDIVRLPASRAKGARTHDLCLLTSDSRQLSTIRKTYEKPSRHLEVPLRVTAHVGQPLRMTALSKEEVTVFLPGPLEKARTAALDLSRWEEQLSRTQDTPYRFRPITIDADPDVFVPVSRINQLRRSLIEALSQSMTRIPSRRENPYAPQIANSNPSIDNIPGVTVEVRTEEQLSAALAYPVYPFVQDMSLYRKYSGRAGLSLPRYCRGDSFPDVQTALVQEPGELNLPIPVKFGSLYLNVSNPHAVRFLEGEGLSRVELSRELHSGQIRLLAEGYRSLYHRDPPIQILLYGRRDLMISQYCAPNTLCTKSQKPHCGVCREHAYQLEGRHRRYPLSFDSRCMMHILESSPYNQIQQAGLYRKMGIRFFRFLFTTETPAEVRTILDSFFR